MEAKPLDSLLEEEEVAFVLEVDPEPDVFEAYTS